jgi:large exoprotein involved in heme utilization and adhesion
MKQVATHLWLTSSIALGCLVTHNTPPTPTTPKSSTPELLMEANGWITNENGQVELMATAPTVTPHVFWQPPVNCRQVSQTDSQ